MHVTRDVILDLLPLYAAGEVSADTRTLVDAFLASDPELAGRLKANGLSMLADEDRAALGPAPAFEARVLRRVRGWMAWQRRLYAWAMTLTGLALAGVFYVDNGTWHLRWLPLNYPGVFGALASMAASLWISYWWVARRVARGR